MRKSDPQLRTSLAIAGVFLLVASVALVVGSVRPTEASWQDTVTGTSSFTTHKDVGRNSARATAAYGSMTYRIADQENLRKVEALGKSDSAVLGLSTGPTTRSVRGALLSIPASVAGTVCARSTATGVICSEDPQSTATAFAQAQSSKLEVSTVGLPLVRYATADDAKPTIATAACTPGKPGVTGFTKNGSVYESVYLGRGSSLVEVPMPGRNSETRKQRTYGSVTYTARLQRTEVSELGYARAELRLHVTADGATGDPWTLHLILANAECGVSRGIEENLAQPTATNFQSLAPSVASFRTAQPPTALKPIIDVVDEDAPERPDDGTTLPTLDGAADDSATGATTSATTSTESPGPLDAETADLDPRAELGESAGAETAVPTENAAPTTSEPTTALTAPTGPQELESVRVGREFAVVNRDGVELGTAKVDDIVRTPGCGVELTLSITTSAEAGPDRWASVAPDDFAEVRPGGSTREASRISSDCERAARSTTTSLSPGRDYEIVIAFQLDDSADQAMLRPDGTAGWIFDLPSLTTVAVTTSPTAATATEQAPGASTDTGTELTSAVETTEA